jgi:hypothetical protein
MSNPKELAQKLYSDAKESHVRFPKIWDESKTVQMCGATLVSFLLSFEARVFLNAVCNDLLLCRCYIEMEEILTLIQH